MPSLLFLDIRLRAAPLIPLRCSSSLSFSFVMGFSSLAPVPYIMACTDSAIFSKQLHFLEPSVMYGYIRSLLHGSWHRAGCDYYESSTTVVVRLIPPLERSNNGAKSGHWGYAGARQKRDDNITLTSTLLSVSVSVPIYAFIFSCFFGPIYASSFSVDCCNFLFMFSSCCRC